MFNVSETCRPELIDCGRNELPFMLQSIISSEQGELVSTNSGDFLQRNGRIGRRQTSLLVGGNQLKLRRNKKKEILRGGWREIFWSIKGVF